MQALDEVFAVVGLTERYETFYAMLAALLPAAPAGFWEREVARRENPSVKSTAAVLALLSPRARRRRSIGPCATSALYTTPLSSSMTGGAWSTSAPSDVPREAAEPPVDKAGWYT